MGSAMERLEFWRARLAEGKTILVVDYDGPKVAPDDSDPSEVVYHRPCQVVNLELLRKKIDETRFQFGHGYIVAAALLGIGPEQYTRSGTPDPAPMPMPMPMPALVPVSPRVSVKVKARPRTRVRASVVKARPRSLKKECSCCSNMVGDVEN